MNPISFYVLYSPISHLCRCRIDDELGNCAKRTTEFTIQRTSTAFVVATYEASLGTYWTLLRTWSYKHQDRTQNKEGLLYFCKIHPNCRAFAGPVSRNISSATICVWLWVRESGNREYYGKQMTGDCIY